MKAVNEFCRYHKIELSFIYSLNECGLVDITSIEEKVFVPISQLGQLERLVRLKVEMNINLEGIETITYLLQRLNNSRQHILQLQNKLAFYEDPETIIFLKD